MARGYDVIIERCSAECPKHGPCDEWLTDEYIRGETDDDGFPLTCPLNKLIEIREE
jgi:hypothetical protein